VWARPPLEAEQKNLEHRVEFATVNLQLAEEYKAQLNPPAPSISTPDSQRSGRGLLQCVGNHPRLCFVSCRIRTYAADLAAVYSCSHLCALAPISPLAGRRRMRKLSELRDLEVWRRDAPSSAGRMRRGRHPQMSPTLGPFNISLTSVSLPLLRRVLHSWLAARQAVAEYWRGQHKFSVQLRYCSRG
jgi:hypothetical protein